jgi:hypothetical protein
MVNIAAFGEHLGKSMWLIGQKVRLSSREELLDRDDNRN